MPLPLAERTVAAIKDELKGSFLRYWDERTRIAWDNKRFVPEAQDDEDGYVRVSMQHIPGGSGPAGIESGGAKRYRRQAIITVQVLTKLGSGESKSSCLTEAALKFFEVEPPIPGAWYRNPSPNEIDDDALGYYQVNVTATMIYETLRA